MEGISSKRTYAFITAYLLGVERKVLERDYTEDYIFSEGLEHFKSIDKAPIIRSLSRVKQNIFRVYGLYSKTDDFMEVAESRILDELHLLKDAGIDLNNEFRLHLEIAPVINKISEHINLYLDEVLEYFKFPYQDMVKNLFYVYPLEKKSMASLVNSIKDNWSKFPHGIVIVRGKRVLHHLPRILQDDDNLIKGIHNIAGEEMPDFYDSREYKWSKLESKPILPTLPIKDSSILYVDCDNTDFFIFLGMLEGLNRAISKGEKHIIKLYKDSMTSPIWGLANKVIEGKFDLEIIDVNRIKDTKSVVDIVIATHITRDSQLQPEVEKVIVSSDSDFFGLIESGVNLAVLYDGKCTNYEYLTYLNRKRIINFDLSTLLVEENLMGYRNTIMTHLCLTHLVDLPMTQWTDKAITESIMSKYDEEIGYGMELTEVEVSYTIREIMKELKMEMKGSEISLSADGVEVSLKIA